MMNKFTSSLLLLAAATATAVDIDTTYESEPVLQIDENHLYEQYFRQHVHELENGTDDDGVEHDYEDPDFAACEYTLDYINALDVDSQHEHHVESQTYRCDSGFALLNDLVVSVHDNEGFYFKSNDRPLLISGIHMDASETSYSNCMKLREEHEDAFFPSYNDLDLSATSAESRELRETVEEFVNESHCVDEHHENDEQQTCSGRSYVEIYANTWYKIVYRADCNQFEVLHCEDDNLELCQ